MRKSSSTKEVTTRSRLPAGVVPGGYRADIGQADSCVPSPHEVEAAVQRFLLARPDLRFSSLVIRRIHGGVCLEGIVEAGENSPDVADLAACVAGVDQVMDRLVVRRPPEKG